MAKINSFLIPVPNEFSFDLCLDFLKRSPRELLHVCQEASVLKLLKIKSKPVLFKMEMADAANVHVSILNESLLPNEKIALEKYIREWFDLDTDLQPFYKLAGKDKILSGLAKQFHGYRIIGQPDLFESIVWAVLGQQINLQFAYTLKQRFVENFGERATHGEKEYYLFPQASVVATLTDSHLLPLQFSRQKSKYVILIGEAFAANQISKEMISTLPFEEAKAQLMKIKGVGNWTANYALMKTFRYPTAFPLEDAGLHNAIKNHWKLGRKPTLEEVKKIFKKYKGWEAYATLYFWKSL
jgi:DNA-3-methyladenine glycosylase II